MLLRVEKLCKAFQLKKEKEPFLVLKDLDFNIKRGEIYGIIGTSGAGKSTLLRCLTLLESPTDGKIWYEDEELTALSYDSLVAHRRHFGMIFQNFNLFSSRTALENVCFPLELDGLPPDVRKAKALELLHLVGLKGKEKRYPAQLSGGEKQRVAIARALARDPTILFCDEPTSALDPRTTRDLLQLLSDLNRRLHLTIVLITHQMEIVKQICHRVCVLEHGEIVEQGDVLTLFSSPQHPTTRYFLQHLPHEIPESFHPKSTEGQLVRLYFRGDRAQQPIISQMVKESGVDVNILLGGIDVLQQTMIGSLVIELRGSYETRAKAKLYLEQNGVRCEVIHS